MEENTLSSIGYIFFTYIGEKKRTNLYLLKIAAQVMAPKVDLGGQLVGNSSEIMYV